MTINKLHSHHFAVVVVDLLLFINITIGLKTENDELPQSSILIASEDTVQVYQLNGTSGVALPWRDSALKVFEWSTIVYCAEAIWLIGGYFSESGLYRFDPVNNTMEPMTPMPDGRHYHTAVCIEPAELILVCGGDNSTVTQSSCLQYSINQSAWRTAPEMLHTKTLHQSVIIDDVVYVFGGYEHDFPEIMSLPARTKDLFALDLSTLTKEEDSTTQFISLSLQWQSRAIMLKHRANFAATVHNGYIWACGGSFDRSLECEAYNPILDEWHELRPMDYGSRCPHYTNGTSGLTNFVEFFEGDIHHDLSTTVCWCAPTTSTKAPITIAGREIEESNVQPADLGPLAYAVSGRQAILLPFHVFNSMESEALLAEWNITEMFPIEEPSTVDYVIPVIPTERPNRKLTPEEIIELIFPNSDETTINLETAGKKMKIQPHERWFLNSADNTLKRERFEWGLKILGMTAEEAVRLFYDKRHIEGEEKIIDGPMNNQTLTTTCNWHLALTIIGSANLVLLLVLILHRLCDRNRYIAVNTAEHNV